MRLSSLRIVNCFGFQDSGPVNLENPHNLIYVLGRNSSGKTSLLEAIKSLSHAQRLGGLGRPDEHPNFANFRPSNETPRLIAEFTINKDDLSTERLIENVLSMLNDSLSITLTREHPALTNLWPTLEDFYQPLFAAAGDLGRIIVEKYGSGSYRFLTIPESYEDYQARRSGVTEALRSILTNGNLEIQNVQYPVNLSAEIIEGRLLFQFPLIYSFGMQYPLNEDLPERIELQQLSGERRGLMRAFINYLGADAMTTLLNSNDPDERGEIRRQLQEKADNLCRKANQRRENVSGDPDLVSMTLDEHGGGIQITVKTDGQPSFYRHMSDSTKVLMAYSIYHEAYNLRQAILIFDEPSTGMHPTAQEAVLAFLKSLGHQGHQVILSTHSEYLIDLDLLGSIRIMTKGASGGLAVNDSFYRSARGQGDDLALQPVVDAIGLRFGGQINIRDRVVITEGITDMLYLRAFRKVLGYEDNLDIAPARSAPQILRLIPFFISQGISLKIVMDTGPITREMQRDFEVSDEYIWEVPIPEDFTDRMTGSGIEDLFTKNDFRKLMGSVHVTVEEDQFAQVSNGYYMKDRRALKKSLAHHLYEHADDIDIEFDQETKDNFASVLDFCVNDEWFTI